MEQIFLFKTVVPQSVTLAMKILVVLQKDGAGIPLITVHVLVVLTIAVS